MQTTEVNSNFITNNNIINEDKDKYKDKEYIKKLLCKKEFNILENLDDSLKDDKEFMIEAISIHVNAANYLSNRLKLDREIVKATIEIEARKILIFDHFKTDRELVMIAVKKNGRILKYLNDELKNDKEIVCAAISNNRYCLSYASEKLKDDKYVSLIAVTHFGDSLFYVSDRLKNDKEIVMRAVKSNPQSIIYASKELQQDKSIILLSNSIYEIPIERMSERFKMNLYFE